MHTGFKCGGLRERDHLGDLDVDGCLNNKMCVQEVGWWTWTELFWLRIGTGGGNL